MKKKLRTKTLIKWASIVLIGMCSTSVFAQQSFMKSIKETQELSESTSLLLLDNKIIDALDKLFPFWHDEQEMLEFKKQGIQLIFQLIKKSLESF